MILNGEPQVAKRFYEIGEAGHVTPLRNRQEIEKEGIRLSLADYFLTRMKERAYEKKVDIAKGTYMHPTFLQSLSSLFLQMFW